MPKTVAECMSKISSSVSKDKVRLAVLMSNAMRNNDRLLGDERNEALLIIAKIVMYDTKIGLAFDDENCPPPETALHNFNILAETLSQCSLFIKAVDVQMQNLNTKGLSIFLTRTNQLSPIIISYYNNLTNLEQQSTNQTRMDNLELLVDDTQKKFGNFAAPKRNH